MKTSKRKLSGAETKWKENPNLIYISKYRLAGTVDDVADFLINYNVDINVPYKNITKTKEFLKSNAYSSENIKNVKSIYNKYQQELTTSKKSSYPNIDFDKISKQSRYELLDDNGKVIVNHTRRVSVNTKSEFTNGAVTDLSKFWHNNTPEKLRNNKKVLDVSRLKNDGKGSKIMNEPTKRSKKFFDTVSRIISDNYSTYRLVEDFNINLSNDSLEKAKEKFGSPSPTQFSTSTSYTSNSLSLSPNKIRNKKISSKLESNTNKSKSIISKVNQSNGFEESENENEKSDRQKSIEDVIVKVDNNKSISLKNTPVPGSTKNKKSLNSSVSPVELNNNKLMSPLYGSTKKNMGFGDIGKQNSYEEFDDLDD